MKAARPQAAAAAAPASRAHTLLLKAHDTLDALEGAALRLAQRGVASGEIPARPALMGMALLGEHGRADVLRSLTPLWPGLCAKGLVRGALSDHPAPMLRLMLAVEPATQGLDDVRTRLSAADATEAPTGLLRCARRVRDVSWGQRVRVHFQTSGVDYLLIEPEAVFGVAPTLLNLGGGTHQGEFMLVGEDGEVVFTLLDSQGQVFRQSLVLELRDARSALEGWT